MTKFTVIYACPDSPVSAGDEIEGKLNIVYECHICEDTGEMCGGCGGWGDVCDGKQKRDRAEVS